MLRTGAITWTAVVLVALLFVPVIDGGDKFGWLRLWQVYWMLWTGFKLCFWLVMAGLLLVLALHVVVSVTVGAFLTWCMVWWLGWIKSDESPSAPSARP